VEDGAGVVALVNGGDHPVVRRVLLADIGPRIDAAYRVQDLWEPGAEGGASSSFTVELHSGAAALFR
jgi:hypothetical protein